MTERAPSESHPSTSGVERDDVATLPPPEQLPLPLGGAEDLAPFSRIPLGDRVFVNRHLNLAGIEWLGFDMDYTLAIYNQQALDDLSVDLTIQRMLRRGYPSYLSRLQYDTRFPIRGLLVDKRFGNVLKMDRFKGVHKGYHGLRPLTRSELQELYVRKQVRPHTARYHWIDTLFSLSEVTSYAAIVDAMERHGAHVDFAQVFQDVRSSIDEAHRDGDFYAHVTRDLNRYVMPDSALEATLHKFRSAGKRLFLLTNSPWSYTTTLMNHLLGGSSREYPSWQHYFDVVIVSAQKPVWFHEGKPFMELSPSGRVSTRTLERGKVYEGGNLRDFERFLEIRGSSVLYVGDHIYGDILRSKKQSTWRTAMIIQELDSEVAAHKACASKFARLSELEATRDQLEDDLRFYQSRYKQYCKDTHAEDEAERAKRAIETLRQELRAIDTKSHRITASIDRGFHPYWGSTLKEAGEFSSFGIQVENYADIYMRRVSSLRHYSPLQHYRSPRDLMPHEL